MNDRAREILSYVQRFTRDKGFPPTIREIGIAFGISSTNGVRYYLDMLEKAGMLSRKGKISRGIGPVGPLLPNLGIPILGRVAAGQPILAEESLEGHLELSDVFGDVHRLFALRVRGDSMIDAGIYENDYVIVKNQDRADPGEIVVALLDDEATVKYYRPPTGRRGKDARSGAIELVAANEKYAPIVVEEDTDFRILGVVTGVIRTIGR